MADVDRAVFRLAVFKKKPVRLRQEATEFASKGNYRVFFTVMNAGGKNGEDDFSNSSGTDVITRNDQKTDVPRRYKVILLNDNYTSMEFVVLVLRSVFHKPQSEAETIMISVHERGAGVAGVYTKEIAETKIALVHHLARQSEFPLRCTMEPE